MTAQEEDGYVSAYLTHFVGGSKRQQEQQEQFDLLCKIIGEGQLLPGGRPEGAPGNLEIRLNKALSGNEAFIPDMVCFCDIPLNADILRIHTQKYSGFGLAFDKAWLAQERGVSPVFYLARGSCCTDHRFPNGHPRRLTTRERFFDLAGHDWQKGYAAGGLPPDAHARADNMFLWYVLSYCKFFDETLPDQDEHNFYMEREWRTIGAVAFSQTDIRCVVLPQSHQQEFEAKFPALRERVLPLKGSEASPPCRGNGS
jgi:hypothetical protein